VVAVLVPATHPSAQLVATPARYRPADFLRLGLPLTALTAVVVVALAPLVWPAR
jgi:di/tricarboxylate transporter